jgi:fatty acid desaturase
LGCATSTIMALLSAHRQTPVPAAMKIVLRWVALVLAFATIIVGVASIVWGFSATWPGILALMTVGIGMTSNRMKPQDRMKPKE